MINRDGSPSAITGATVPETWYADVERIVAPLSNLYPKWPFRLQKALPRFEAADTLVFGVSVDSHYSNAAFARTARMSTA